MVSNASARKICIPPTLSSGRNTIATTIIPIPPNHCKIPLHKRIPFGRSSSPDKTVEPVVVTPDTASKRASTNESWVLPIIKGIEPNSGNATHTPVVKRIVFWISRPSDFPFEHAIARKLPVNIVISALSAKTPTNPRPSEKSMPIGINIVIPNRVRRMPIT